MKSPVTILFFWFLCVWQSKGGRWLLFLILWLAWVSTWFDIHHFKKDDILSEVGNWRAVQKILPWIKTQTYPRIWMDQHILFPFFMLLCLLSFRILKKLFICMYMHIYGTIFNTLQFCWHHNYIFTSYAYSDKWWERGEINASCMNDVVHVSRWEVQIVVW